MSRELDTISAMNPSKDLWKIAVRVLEIWPSTDWKKEEILEMLFIDANGHKIHVEVPHEILQDWKGKLTEGMTYHIQNFTVKEYKQTFKLAEHQYKLFFNFATHSKQFNHPEIPHFTFTFKDFGEILIGQYNSRQLYDIIGAVNDITHTLSPNDKHKRMVFTLKDPSGNIVNCTLWEDYAIKFFESWSQRDYSSPFIIILTHARVKPEDNYPLSIVNSWSGSKLILNEDIPAITEFKNSFAPDQLIEISTQSQTQLTQSSQFSEGDRFTYKTTIKTIAEINQLTEDTFCATVATITRINVNKNGWYFLGCLHCPKRPTQDGNIYHCKCGRDSDHLVPRYKIEVQVNYNGETANFLLWDTECAEIIENSALQLKEIMRQEGEDDPKIYPVQLDRLIAKTLAMKLKVKIGKTRQCSVFKASRDETIIQSVLDKMQPQEETSNLLKGKEKQHAFLTLDTQSFSEAANIQTLSGSADHDPKVDGSNSPAKKPSARTICDEMTGNIQNLSAMADYDPEVESSITPAKRGFVQDDLISPGLKNTQQSSTKILKTIKKEKI